MPLSETLAILLIGLGGGIAGGLLGIGGSIVMIPLLTLAYGPNQQLYQAACMIVNVVVAVSASIRHARAGTVRMDHFRWMFPAAGGAIIVGVMCSNMVPTEGLRRLFAVFLLYTATIECIRLLRSHPEPEPSESVTHPGRSLGIGALTGLVGGLLGVGGGTIAVPLLRRASGLPLRQAIATSSAAMTLASVIGATAKNASVGSLHAPDGTALTLGQSLTLAGLMSVPAFVGAFIGAAGTYRLPLHAVRVAFILLLGLAGARMLGLLGS